MSFKFNEEFDARQVAASNGEPPIYHDGWVLFANGAKRENASTAGMFEPPSPRNNGGADELLRARVLYCEVALEQATTAFDKQKKEYKQQFEDRHFSPSDEETERAAEHLKRLKAAVKRAKRKLEAFYPSKQQQKEQQKRQAEQAAASDAFNTKRRIKFANAIDPIEI